MKLRRQMLLKIVAGVLMVVLSALLAFAVRDALAMREPVNALPLLDVYQLGESEPIVTTPKQVRRTSYEWRFLFGIKSWTSPDLEAWREISPVWVQPNVPLELSFSESCKSFTVSMAAGERGFNEVVNLQTPPVAGKYTYRVEASWGNNKQVTYYFRLEVPDTGIMR